MLLKRYKNIEEEGLQRAWKSFENSGAMVSPFLYYDYMKWIFNGGFLNNRGYKPFVECVENEAGETLAIFPMKKKFLFGTKIKMLGDVQGCGCAGGIFSPKLSDSEKEKCIRLFFKTLFERGNVRLSRIREDSLGYRYMKKIFEQVPRLKKQACVAIEFGDDYEAYLKSLSSSVRQNLRTADNRMRRDGHEWKLRVFLPGEKIDDESFKQIMKLYLARLFGHYRQNLGANWLRRMKNSYFYNHIKHDTLSLRNNTNACHFILYIDGLPACFMSGFADHKGKKIVVPRLAIDESRRFYSPGYVMIRDAVRYLMENTDFRTLDLSRGSEKYKLDLGGKIYETISMELKKPMKV